MEKEYKSFADLAADLAFHEAGMTAALLEIGERLEKVAKRKIGHQQPGWEPLKESTEAEKTRKGYPANAPLLATGHMRDSISHEVEGLVLTVGSTDEKMIFHEFGTEKMPPRPVLGPLVEDERRFIIKTIVKYTARSFGRSGEWTPPDVLYQLHRGDNDGE